MSTLEDRSKQFAKDRADGQAARKRGDRQAALNHFASAQKISPTDAGNNYEIAVLLRELKRNDEAIQAYEKVIAEVPRHGDALRGIGLVERARGDRAKAGHWFSRALEVDPSGVQNKLDLAFELRETMQNKSADTLYSEVLSVQPTNTFALRGRAMVARASGERQAALNYFRRAAEAAPTDTLLLHDVATELRELGQLDDAKTTYETVVAKHPDHGYAWRGLGLVALAQNRPDDAIAALQAAAQRLPNVPGILTDLSQALKLGERTSELEQLWLRMEQTPALRATVCHQRAIAARDIGRNDAVVPLLVQAVEFDGRNMSVRQLLASELRQRRRYGEAEAQYQAMLQINPGFVAALIGLAQLRAQAGDRASAEVHLQRAREVAPDNIAVVLEIAGMQTDTGRHADAVATITSALRKSPDNLNCMMKLGMIERARGNAAAAAAHFRAASAAHPHHLLAYVELATEEFRLGNPGAAQDLLRNVLAVKPDHVEALAQIATQAQAAGDHETAFTHFLKAYELRPSSYWYGLAAASLAATVRSVAEAEHLFARIEMDEIARPAAKMQRGNLYRSLARLHEAEVLLQDAFNEAPQHFTAWLALFRLETYLGHHEQATALLARAPRQTHHDDATIAYVQGEMELLRWNVDPAIAYFRSALALVEANPSVHNYMAIAGIMSCRTALADQHVGRHAALQAAVALSKGASPNRTQSLFGQIIDEMRIYQAANDEAARILGEPGTDRLGSIMDVLQSEPEATTVSMALIVEAQRTGRFARATQATPVVAPGPGSGVPKRIFQFWQSRTEQPDILAMMDEWRDRHPDFEYERFDVASALAFLRSHAAPGVVRAFQLAREVAQKCDVFRLAYLFHKGGLYIDADDRCARPLHRDALSSCDFLGYLEHLGSLGNNVLGAAAGNAIIGRALASCAEAINRGDREIIWLMTGPGLITRVFANELAAHREILSAFLSRIRVMDRHEVFGIAGIHSLAAYKITNQHWSKNIASTSNSNRTSDMKSK